MATQTFKVSKTGVEAIEVSREVPDNIDDPRWSDIVVNPSEDIHELALQALIVKCQAGARARLDQGTVAVQAYVEAYTRKVWDAIALICNVDAPTAEDPDNA